MCLQNIAGLLHWNPVGNYVTTIHMQLHLRGLNISAVHRVCLSQMIGFERDTVHGTTFLY